ncbi:unnamed protein product [Nippostrongylus brasiliensis]|uniref:Gex-3-interacting protein 13 (inferred by orthology to a C. elegans protein) n=1 Tax=Nippostrongylus brasiliensis TaxID=27835 RepID=A0A158R3K4_NIPBR|nr:unnamed protein product [Nippostrongylus brasiliensis]
MTPEQFTSHFNFLNPMKREIPAAPHGTDANGMPQPKRRRLRRHPMVGCINCSFRTGSAFSTNLKMHLKAHHKDDYERVLKLEGDMRVEENVTGPPNKIKNELIDFIRGGGNASTANAAHPSAPRASPLIQQFISQTMASRQDTPVKKESVDEDPFNGMSMSDKLAALVGLMPAPAGGVDGAEADAKQDDEPEEPVPSVQSAFDEIRRAADNMLAANMGLAPPPQEQTIVNLNGSVVTTETQSTSSASTDDCDEKKVDRDMALAKFWFSEGANNNLLQSEHFKEMPEVDSGTTAAAETFISGLAALNQLLVPSVESTDSAGPSTGSSVADSPPIFNVSTLTYDGLFDGLTSLQKNFGVDELTSFVITIQLLKSSARSDEERLIADTVSGGLERIYNLNFETNKSERTKKLISEKMKLKRLFETSEQREHRLQRMKERYRLQRSAIEGEIPDKRRKEFRSGSVTAEDGDRDSRTKEERLLRLRDYQRRRLLNEKPEQRARRLAKMRENQKLRRARQMAQRNASHSSSSTDFVRTLAPDYEIPEAGDLAGLVDVDITSVQQH